MQPDYEKMADAVVQSAKRYIDATVKPLQERIRQLETRPLAGDGIGIAGAVKSADGVLILTLTDGRILDTAIRDGMNGKDGTDGKDGKSVSVDDLAPVIVAEVEKASTEIEQVASDIVEKSVAAAVATIQETRRPDPAVVAELEARVAKAVTAAIAAMPPPAAGKDADMGAIAEMVVAEVRKAVDALPKPKDGKDGVGLAGALISREGNLIVTLADGTTRDLGRVEGKDADIEVLRAEIKTMIEALPRPKDGIDGVGFDDLEFEHDDTGAFLTFMRGENRKRFRLPIVIDRGVYDDKKAYHEGDGVTWGGSFWIAQRDTKAKPDAANGDWRLAVKKGRDGKDAAVIKTGKG